jgi:MYXO-CTERM domain-containing protein
VRSIIATGGSAIGADFSTIEVTGTSAVLTVVAPEIGDTGDTGELPDTGGPAEPVDTGDPGPEGEVDTGLEEADPGGIDPVDDDDAAESEDKSGCGCSSAPGPGGWVFLVALGAVLYRRRI